MKQGGVGVPTFVSDVEGSGEDVCVLHARVHPRELRRLAHPQGPLLVGARDGEGGEGLKRDGRERKRVRQVMHGSREMGGVDFVV